MGSRSPANIKWYLYKCTCQVNTMIKIYLIAFAILLHPSRNWERNETGRTVAISVDLPILNRIGHALNMWTRLIFYLLSNMACVSLELIVGILFTLSETTTRDLSNLLRWTNLIIFIIRLITRRVIGLREWLRNSGCQKNLIIFVSTSFSSEQYVDIVPFHIKDQNVELHRVKR